MSKLYADAWNQWPEDVRQHQALAPDGKPFNDNPTPCSSPTGETVYSQCMVTSCDNGHSHRVASVDHVVYFEEKFLFLESSEDEGIDDWPHVNSQALMSCISEMNYYAHDSPEPEWKYGATVVSSRITGATFMSYLQRNVLKPGRRKQCGHIHWIHSRGTLTDGLVSTPAEHEKVNKKMKKIINARHGPTPQEGFDKPTTAILLGSTFEENMLNILTMLNKQSTVRQDLTINDTNLSITMPRLRRLVFVHPNGFTQDLFDALFDKKRGHLKGRTPVRAFKNLRDPGNEIEIVVFPISLSAFWGNSKFNHYEHENQRHKAFLSTLKQKLPILKRKQYKNDSKMKEILATIDKKLKRDQPTALSRNTATKVDLKGVSDDTVVVRLYEVGSCANLACKAAGPAGYACSCGLGIYLSHVNQPSMRKRLPNQFYDSSDNSSDESEDDSSDESSDESSGESSDESSDESSEDDKDNDRVRKTRCGACANCIREDCGKCKHCLDKTKFGGPNKIRKPCLKRVCRRMSFEQKKRSSTDLNRTPSKKHKK